ncbi:right-handed parallel beta-helix repeat-containing protein [Leifsonia sp. 2MCAF36]|uniref:right-handed parallel beta-helix repeat-containing protein n=1 Tax=Leifsonia sp. 2MCAF36 TaxID=3232988 RepID=UPI003F9812B1
MTGDIDVLLAGGTYTVTSPLTFGAADSGTSGHRVSWEPVAGATPVLSGGQILTGWTQVPGTGIWQASAGAGVDPREFYINGARQAQASIGGSVVSALGLTTTSSGYTSTSAAPLSWQDPGNVEMIWNSTHLWQNSRCRVSSIAANGSGAAITMVQPCFANAVTVGNSLPSTVSGSYSFISAPGQWSYSASTQKVYYEPRAGETLSSETTVIPRAGSLLDFAGSASSPVHDITVQGLSFQYATWTQPSSPAGQVETYGDLQYVDSSTLSTTPGDVSGEGARNISILGNTFSHLGAAGLSFSNGSQSDTITGNSFTDISASGIVLGNARDAAAGTNDQNGGFTVTDNFIASVGQQYLGSLGIYATMVYGTTISHNYLTNLPYSGISTGYNGHVTAGIPGGTSTTATYAHDNVISHNRVQNTMLSKSDGGAIYAWGPESSGPTTGRLQVFGNYTNHTLNQGLYADENSAYEDWHDNVFERVGANWLNLSPTAIHDLTVQNNYSDNARQVTNGTNVVVSGNYTSGRPWPSAAQAIIGAAGLEPAYASIVAGATAVDDSASSSVVYSGSWVHCTSSCNTTFGASYVGGTVSYTNTANASVTVTWTGTQADYIASVGASGFAAVSVDGGPETMVDLYAPSNASKLVWTTPLLADGTHTMTIRATGTKDATSTSTYIALDAVIAHAANYVDDSFPDVSYSGTSWAHCTLDCNAALGAQLIYGTTSYSSHAGDSATLSWTGTQIAYYGVTGNSGIAGVSVDGGTATNVNLSSASNVGGVLLYTSPVLAAGAHTITVTVTGTHTGSNANWVSIDGFVVAP